MIKGTFSGLWVGVMVSVMLITSQTVHAYIPPIITPATPVPAPTTTYPMYGGVPVCSAAVPCTVENQDDAVNILSVYPNAVVRVDDDDDDDDGDEDNDNNDDEGDDEGVRNKLENINESTNDEDVPITQPDNVGNDDTNLQQPQPLAQQQGQLQQQEVDTSGQDLVDLCVQQGLSVNTCNNYLLSKNVGGACQLAAAGGGGCAGGVQDPLKTFSDPGAAAAESNKKIQQLENGLQGFAQTQQQTEQQKKTIENSLRLNPPGDLGSIFAGPGSTTNRPGQ